MILIVNNRDKSYMCTCVCMYLCSILMIHLCNNFASTKHIGKDVCYLNMYTVKYYA